jgi:hypothetical protein
MRLKTNLFKTENSERQRCEISAFFASACEMMTTRLAWFFEHLRNYYVCALYVCRPVRRRRNSASTSLPPLNVQHKAHFHQGNGKHVTQFFSTSQMRRCWLRNTQIRMSDSFPLPPNRCQREIFHYGGMLSVLCAHLRFVLSNLTSVCSYEAAMNKRNAESLPLTKKEMGKERGGRSLKLFKTKFKFLFN